MAESPRAPSGSASGSPSTRPAAPAEGLDAAALALLLRAQASGLIDAVDAALCRAVVRRTGEHDPWVLALLAGCSRAVRDGHIAVELDEWLRGPWASCARGEPGLATAAALPWPGDVPALHAVLARSPNVVIEAAGAPPGRGTLAPLVCDAGGRAYLRRDFDHQQALAQALTARICDDRDARGAAAGLSPPRSDAELDAILDELFAGAPVAGQPDWQREAARAAATRRFTVVSGGPGTGKTSTIVKLLACKAELAVRRGLPAPTVALLAPTGKAAARMLEAMRNVMARPDAPGLVLRHADALPDRAMTIHRALGLVPGMELREQLGPAPRARRGIQGDIVVVDEASMVDLALMRRLLDAVAPQATVVLLGDRDQLASVEAGAVLAEIAEAAQSEPGPLRAACVQLEHSYRFDAASGIGALARAIQAGDADAALAVLADPARPDVALAGVEPLAGRSVDDAPSARAVAAVAEAAAHLAATAFAPVYGAELRPEQRLRALDRARVLCAHREGALGVEGLTPRIVAALAQRRLPAFRPHARGLGGAGGRDGAAFEGRPVLIRRNDPGLGLWNGDVGLVLEPSAGARPQVAFPPLEPDRPLRWIAPARLPEHETALAMTIHKSQGSEFEHVIVVLPERRSPLLTRELLYTAVTRAQRQVTIVGRPELVREAVCERAKRVSGLGDALRAMVRPR